MTGSEMTPERAAFEIFHQVKEGTFTCEDILAILQAQREAQLLQDVRTVETAFCTPVMTAEQARGWFISALTGQLWMEASLIEEWKMPESDSEDESSSQRNPGLGWNGMLSSAEDWE